MKSEHMLSDDVKKTARDWLVKLQSANLTEGEQEAFFSWLEQKPEHAQAYILAEEVWQRSGALKHLEYSEDEANSKQEMEVVAAASNSRKKLLGSFVNPYIGLAACLMLAVLSVALFTDFKNEETLVDQAVVYQTNVGEQKSIALADGSVITLNTNARVKSQINRTDHRYLNIEQGEVFFDIAADPDKPFTVKTANGWVVVLGTRFSVFNRGEDSLVTVEEGKVGLLPGVAQWNKQIPEIELSANQQLSLSSAAKNQAPQEIHVDQALSWRNGHLVFKGNSLQQVVDDLNRYYKTNIKIGDDSLKSKEVVALVPLDNSFSAMLSSLELSLGLVAKPAPDGKSYILTQ